MTLLLFDNEFLISCLHQVFDGMVVGDNELAEAREKHMGRLTRDMLEEFMGINAFKNITVRK